ncbi:type II and III secretion system protein family protein [Asticcacaulis sp. 201]|uniref:type II and III secretion system protein family protein n=1 Tax=Asticcacaulis sp. 201 TaxID=3028787 RepID=UPI002916AD35|nr:type II and III secretion system protein family protein [Asticcacaulis sp. 201]MDV6332075.1 type II and III secretion system protein family protein [Asticcacaulis sp. 201]
MISKIRKTAILSAGAVLSAVAVFGAGAVSAEPKAYANTSGGYSGAASGVQVQTGAPAKVQVLNLPKGRSAVIDLPVDASDVFVSNPAIADAVLRTPRRIFVLGVASGSSDAIFFDGMGRQILNLAIRVDTPTDGLSDTISRLFPDAHVEVQTMNGYVVLSGIAQNDGQAAQISRLAESYAEKPENVLNMMSIAGKDQVTLKVRIVEVNRSVIKQLGLSTDITYSYGTQSYSFGNSSGYSTNGSFQGGKGACYNQAGTATYNGTNTNIVGTPGVPGNSSTTTNTGTASYGVTNKSCLQAFERVGLARTLAEPNLTAVSGESAKFLAGGEFPVQGGTDSQGRVSVQFKPFGVGLGFMPVVLSAGRISLKISTEISELTNVGALVTGSLTIPGLTVRRAETSVEMQSGSSLMIAGLLQSKFKQSIDSLPGLTSVPVIGALLRSRDFLDDQTEMVVLVTPYIVDPTHPADMQTPADNLRPANDLNAVFMGNLNEIVKKKGGQIAGDANGQTAGYQAPVGYVIE